MLYSVITDRAHVLNVIKLNVFKMFCVETTDVAKWFIWKVLLGFN